MPPLDPADHPYGRFENTAAWRHVDAAIRDLVSNNDLIETTRHAYIVGYICKRLSEAGVIESSPQSQ
jgi:hypothetical protein